MGIKVLDGSPYTFMGEASYNCFVKCRFAMFTRD